MKLSDYDIIVIALPRWDGPYSSTAFSISQELSKQHRVFYMDNPYTWKDVITGLNKKSVRSRLISLFLGSNNKKTICPNFFAFTTKAVFPINFLPKGSLYDFFERINNKIVASSINRLVRENQIKQYILINSYNPFYFPLTLSIKPTLLVYQSVDNIEKSNYVAKHGSRKEYEIASVADLVIATSSQLTHKLAPFSKQIACIPNAADISLFTSAITDVLPKPKEWDSFGTKNVIVYTGNICHRLDYELLVRIAEHYKEAILLMVGPSKNKLYENFGLQLLPNVVFTGSKSPKELPAYLKYSSCAIIPFLCNELTASIYPLKINEYLAAGIPVVSTAFSVDITDFSASASVCSNHQAFIKAIGQEIDSDSPQSRYNRNQFAKGNSWENRAKLLSVRLQTLLDHHP